VTIKLPDFNLGLSESESTSQAWVTWCAFTDAQSSPIVILEFGHSLTPAGFEIALDLSLSAVVLYLLAHHEAVGGAAMPAADLLT